MIIPVRCFTCNKVIGNKWESWCQYTKEGLPVEEIFIKIGLRRYCCRRILLTHIEILDKMLLYTEDIEEK